MSGGGRLQGRTALITGGSRGIGFGIAEAFAAEGADLMLCATDIAKLEAAKAGLAQHEGRVELWAGDVSRRDACFELAGEAEKRLGRVDILVNCASIYIPKPFLEYQAEEFERLLGVNLHGPFHLTQAVLPAMISRGYGRVINVASTAGKWASKNQAIYNIAKHGVVGLTRCVALETAGTGVTVNAICPGLVQTDLLTQFLQEHAALNSTTPAAIEADLLKRQPIGRFLDVSECGLLAVYLACEGAGGMTGQSLLLDGGMLFV